MARDKPNARPGIPNSIDPRVLAPPPPPPPIDEEAFSHKILSIAEDNTGDVEPLVISFGEMVSLTSFEYINFEHVTSLMYKVPSDSSSEMTRRSMSSGEPTKHTIMEPRYQVWIAKGPRQFQQCIDAKFHSGHTETFVSLLIGFYKHTFPEESTELSKLSEKDTLWHVVLVGCHVDNMRWEVISSISFTPFKDQETIFLSWIATSDKSADRDLWGNKNVDDQFFDGEPFRSGKGLGSFLISSMQYICRKSTKKSNSYNTIMLQSSIHAIGYYRSSVGMHEMSSDTSDALTGEIDDLILDTDLLTFMHFHGDFNSVRPPGVFSHFYDVKYLLKKSFFEHLLGDKTREFVVDTFPSNLKTNPDSFVLYPSYNNHYLNGTSKKILFLQSLVPYLKRYTRYMTNQIRKI